MSVTREASMKIGVRYDNDTGQQYLRIEDKYTTDGVDHTPNREVIKKAQRLVSTEIEKLTSLGKSVIITVEEER